MYLDTNKKITALVFFFHSERLTKNNSFFLFLIKNNKIHSLVKEYASNSTLNWWKIKNKKTMRKQCKNKIQCFGVKGMSYSILATNTKKIIVCKRCKMMICEIVSVCDVDCRNAMHSNVTVYVVYTMPIRRCVYIFGLNCSSKRPENDCYQPLKSRGNSNEKFVRNKITGSYVC